MGIKSHPRTCKHSLKLTKLVFMIGISDRKFIVRSSIKFGRFCCLYMEKFLFFFFLSLHCTKQQIYCTGTSTCVVQRDSHYLQIRLSLHGKLFSYMKTISVGGKRLMVAHGQPRSQQNRVNR